MFFIDIKSPKVQQNFEAERERERDMEFRCFPSLDFEGVVFENLIF